MHLYTLLWLLALSFIVADARSLVSNGLWLKHKRLALDVLPSDGQSSATTTLPDGGSSVNPVVTSILSSSLPTTTPSLNSITDLTSLPLFPTSSSSISDSPSTLTTTSSSTLSTVPPTSQATSSATTSTTSSSFANNAAQPGTQSSSTSTGVLPAETVPSTDSGDSSGSGGSSGASPSVAPSSSSTASTDSSSGFFSNTGAVAGTFTIVGLVGVAGVIGLGMIIAKRRRANQFDDDIEFLEKTHFEPEPPQQSHHSIEDEPTPTEMGHYGEPMAVAPPPAAYYPNYGYGTAYASHAQAYYDQHIYPPEHYTIAYPLAHQEMPNPYGLAEVDLGQTHHEGNVLDATQPSIRPSTPHPVADCLAVDNRNSVDSFYTGIIDSTETPGEAL